MGGGGEKGGEERRLEDRRLEETRGDSRRGEKRRLEERRREERRGEEGREEKRDRCLPKSRFEDFGWVYERLLELEGCQLISSINGRKEILWGLEKHFRLWTVPEYTIEST
jgi:hypothetical protein